MEYHYDVDADVNPPQASNPYGSFNNRLEWSETLNILEEYPPYPVLSTTYYEYSGDGNVTRVITEVPAGVEMESMAAAPGESPSPPPGEGWGEGGGAAAMAAPPSGEKQYSAVRFGYANNGQAVVFAHGETWTGSSGCPSDYQIPWAREFRYDGARARYMNRKLDPAGLFHIPPVYTDLSTTWTDYDGDEAYGDFTVSGLTVTNTDSYQPGLWRRLKVGTNFVPEYLHNDYLGTLRAVTNTGGTSSGSDAFTAFGERITGQTDRFGYVGAFGYQAHSIAESTNPDTAFPFLHLGARYYDPSSGRFLQRDPIGVLGGVNVYVYGFARPTRAVDPSGLQEGPPLTENPKYRECDGNSNSCLPPLPPPPTGPGHSLGCTSINYIDKALQEVVRLLYIIGNLIQDTIPNPVTPIFDPSEPIRAGRVGAPMG